MTAVTTRSAGGQAASRGLAQTVPDGNNLGKLRRTRVILAVGALLFGLAGAWTVQERSNGAQDAVSHSGPLTSQVQQLYHSLSDADATAATAYLSAGQEPTAVRQKYLDDLATASTALTAATAKANGSSDSAADLATVAQNLPVYAGEIESARANNLQGFPVGARYLNQASQLMQGTILMAAQHLVDIESGNLVSAENTSTSVPYIEIGVGLLFLVALLAAQATESRRTNRLVNAGLLAATAGVVLSAVWLSGAFFIESSAVSQAKKDGSAQVAVLAQAQLDSLKARTDEMLTLVGRGSASDKETDYQKIAEPALTASLGRASALATSDVKGLVDQATSEEAQWNTAHVALRRLDDNNDYAGALLSALTPNAKDGSPSAAKDFTDLQNTLDSAISTTQANFQDRSKKASDDLFGAAAGMAVLGLAMAAAVVAGLGRRISEYR